MRIVFMGTPDFAAISLERLIREGFDVVGVFTQPDKPRGRGMEVSASPVKQIAQAAALPVYQPEKLRDGTALQILRELRPELLVVVAYGRILPDEFLALPKYGAINIHGSLLPKYRGAAPIQWAVLNGDTVTGVSSMYLAHEMDTGDIIYTEETPIGEKETSGELFDRLKELGASLLIRTVRDIEAGKAPRHPQNEAQASYVKMLDKSMSPINWDQSPRAVSKWIFGMQPWPVATMDLAGTTVKVFDAEYTDEKTLLLPGEIVRADKSGLVIACAAGECLRITELQAPGKKRMSAADYLRGHPLGRKA